MGRGGPSALTGGASALARDTLDLPVTTLAFPGGAWGLPPNTLELPGDAPPLELESAPNTLELLNSIVLPPALLPVPPSTLELPGDASLVDGGGPATPAMGGMRSSAAPGRGISTVAPHFWQRIERPAAPSLTR